MAMSHSTGPPPWFEQVRDEQIRRGASRRPRVIQSLRAVGALYLCSVPWYDVFLRRDGSVWAVSAPAFPQVEPYEWQEVTGGLRIAFLCYAATQAPMIRELLPTRPVDAADCPSCSGKDVFTSYALCPVCARCHGLGWVPVAAI